MRNQGGTSPLHVERTRAVIRVDITHYSLLAILRGEEGLRLPEHFELEGLLSLADRHVVVSPLVAG